MERYREYKESGVKWLGEIPSHWELRKMKYTFSERSQKGFPQEPLLASTQTHGVILKSQYENRTVEAIKSLGTLKLVEIGDFVISLRSFQGGLEYAYNRGIISPAYTILTPTHIKADYFKYLSKSDIFISLLKSTVTGIREGQNIDYNKLKDNLLPIPSEKEQISIGSYLDTATSEIDKAIAMQQKMIDLLNERKQIIIQNAVTKGLDENVEMKESGVEWIGRIPKHWEVVRLSHLTSKIGSGSTPKAGYVESGIIFLRSQNVYCEGLKLNDVVHISANVHRNMSGTKVLPNDVLMNITGGSIGRCFYVDETLGEANVNQHVSIIRPTSIDTHYLKYYLQSYCGQIQVSLEQTGGNREGLTAKALAKFLITYPSQSEQKEIAAYLDSEMQRFDSAITNCQRQITLLQERKQIIINEVVTGKVRVI